MTALMLWWIALAILALDVFSLAVVIVHSDDEPLAKLMILLCLLWLFGNALAFFGVPRSLEVTNMVFAYGFVCGGAVGALAAFVIVALVNMRAYEKRRQYRSRGYPPLPHPLPPPPAPPPPPKKAPRARRRDA